MKARIFKKYKLIVFIFVSLVSLFVLLENIEKRTGLSSKASVEKGAVGVFSFSKENEGSSEMIPVIPKKHASKELWFPEVYRRYYNYESGVSIVNTTSWQGTLNFSFYNERGKVVANYQRSIVPNGLLIYYIPDQFLSLPSGVFSLKVTSSVEVVGSLNSVRVGSYETTGYKGFPRSLVSRKLWVQKAWVKAYGHSTGLGIANTLGEALSFKISFIKRGGGLAGEKSINLSPYGRIGLYIPNVVLDNGKKLDNGFMGAAFIEADKSGLVGIYNLAAESGMNKDQITYEMMGEVEIGTSLYFPYIPIIYKEDGEIAGFTYQNTLWSRVSAPNIAYFDSNRKVKELSGSNLSGQEAFYNGNLKYLNLPDGYYSVIINSSGGKLAGLFNPTNDFVENVSDLPNRYAAGSQALSEYCIDTVLYAPQIPKDSYGWEAKVVVQNAGSNEIGVKITYKDYRGRTIKESFKGSIKPGSAFIDTPSLNTNCYAQINVL